MGRHRFIQAVILLAFSVVTGQYIWRIFGPPVPPEYFVGGTCSALTGTDPDMRHLYLRHKFYLSERPRHAWLQTLTRGHVRIYVNGKMLADRSPDGFMGALLVDPTPLLDVGPNVIAIAAEQYSPRRPVMVAFDGAYTLSDGEHRLPSDQSWRCSDKFERGMDWWFMPAFEDKNWADAQIVCGTFRGSVAVPPRALTEPPIGRWITAPDGHRPWASVRRTFELDDKPRQAWLRLTTASMVRLAVNGIVIDVQEDRLATSAPPAAAERVYDLTAYLRSGANVIALVLESSAGPPRLRCDLEAQDVRGKRYRLGSDGQWLSGDGSRVDALCLSGAATADWKPWHVESGHLRVMPWDVTLTFLAPPLPPELWVNRVAGQVVTTAMVFAVGCVCCWAVSRVLSIAGGTMGRTSACGVAYLALVPATIGLAIGWLATKDPRVADQDVYQTVWIGLAAGTVPVQWILLGIFRWIGRRPVAANALTVRQNGASGERVVSLWRHWWCLAALAGIVIAGFIVRLPGIGSRPLGADEVNMYRCVQGVYERGFPSFVVHKDLPPQYISTSEFVYVGGALAALFFDNDRYVIRFPSACWGTLTIVLIYVAGRRMFHYVVGLVAAALYAFAPIPITMADFGRYPSQLQFFTTLTVYFFWRAVSGTGRVDRRFLLWTTLSTIAMFLSWEPSLLVAPGMIVALLWMRRGRLETVLRDGWVWGALATVALTLMLQMAHRNFKQSQRMNYGTGASDVALMPMWRYAQFDIAHFLKAASWSQRDAFPMVGLIGAMILMARHPFRSSITFLLLILLITSGIIALGLPVDADRYSYFLAPQLVLVATAAAIAAARSLRKLVRRDAPAAWIRYTRGMMRIAVPTLLVLAIELNDATAEWDGTMASMNPWAESTRCLGGPAIFLNQHVQPGDIVLGTQPYLLDHQMEMDSRGTSRLDQDDTLWLQSRLHLQAVLDDVRPLPLNRRDGTAMVANFQALTTLFARPVRIWLAVEKGHFNRLNVDEVDAFLRQHMDVVYEDFEAVVLLRDARYRPAALRSRDEKTLREALTDFLRKDAATTTAGSTEAPQSSTAYPLLRPLEDRDEVGPPERRERP